MTLKQLKISEAKEIINNFKVQGANVLTLVQDPKAHDELVKMKSGPEKLCRGFAVGGFIHYAISNLNGKGIVEFCDMTNVSITTAEDRTVVSSLEFNKINCSKNLAILSAITGIKIGKGLLLKFANVHTIIRDLDEILATAKHMKTFLV